LPRKKDVRESGDKPGSVSSRLPCSRQSSVHEDGPGQDRRKATVIPLGQGLLPASSNLPEDFGRAGLKRPPIWSCSKRGLPSLPCHHGNWWALTPPFHPYPAPTLQDNGHEQIVLSGKVGAGRSVFCGTFPGSPLLDVIQRFALWSPDFPPH
jgi:hypothetical protein